MNILRTIAKSISATFSLGVGPILQVSESEWLASDLRAVSEDLDTAFRGLEKAIHEWSQTRVGDR